MRRDWGPNSNAPCWSQPDYIDFWIAWTEELFRDEKSSGFRWGKSHVTDPAHAVVAGAADGIGDVPGFVAGVAGDPGGSAQVAGANPSTNAEPFPDRIAMDHVLLDP